MAERPVTTSDSRAPRRRPSRERATLARLDGLSWPYIIGPYAALDFAFSVRVMDHALAEYLESTLAPLTTDKPARDLYSIVDYSPRFRYRYGLYIGGNKVVRTPVEQGRDADLPWIRRDREGSEDVVDDVAGPFVVPPDDKVEGEHPKGRLAHPVATIG